MSELSGKVGELRATIKIVRAATGKEETIELVGHLDETQLAVLQAAHPEAERKTHGAMGAVMGEGAQLKV